MHKTNKVKMLITLPGRSLSLQNISQIEGNTFNSNIQHIQNSYFTLPYLFNTSLNKFIWWCILAWGSGIFEKNMETHSTYWDITIFVNFIIMVGEKVKFLKQRRKKSQNCLKIFNLVNDAFSRSWVEIFVSNFLTEMANGLIPSDKPLISKIPQGGSILHNFWILKIL